MRSIPCIEPGTSFVNSEKVVFNHGYHADTLVVHF